MPNQQATAGGAVSSVLRRALRADIEPQAHTVMHIQVNRPQTSRGRGLCMPLMLTKSADYVCVLYSRFRHSLAGHPMSETR